MTGVQYSILLCRSAVRHRHRDTYTIKPLFTYVCHRRFCVCASQYIVTRMTNLGAETRTRFGAFFCTCVWYLQADISNRGVRIGLWQKRMCFLCKEFVCIGGLTKKSYICKDARVCTCARNFARVVQGADS